MIFMKRKKIQFGNNGAVYVFDYVFLEWISEIAQMPKTLVPKYYQN